MEKKIKRDIDEVTGFLPLRLIAERLGLNDITFYNWLRDGMPEDIYNLISAAVLEIKIEESGGQCVS